MANVTTISAPDIARQMNPLARRFERWIVVVIYTGCIVQCAVDFLEQTRRVALAGRIAPILRDQPDTIGALEERLAGVTRSVWRGRHGTTVDGKENYIEIHFRPGLMLFVKATTEIDSEFLTGADLVYAGSEVVDLNDLESSLAVVPWWLYGAVCVFGVFLIWAWLRCTRAPHNKWKRLVCDLTAAPIIVYVPIAFWALFRIIA